MNLPVHTTDTLFLDKYLGVSVLEAFVHTILFHRMVHRMVRPIEVGHPVYDSLVYLHSGEEVAERIRGAMETLGERDTGTLVVVFYRIQSRSGWWWGEERTEVEKWRIPIQWYTEYDRSLTHSVKEGRVRDVYDGLLRMLLGQTLDPVPFTISAQGVPFDVMDADKPSRLRDMVQFIVSGPPRMGLFS